MKWRNKMNFNDFERFVQRELPEISNDKLLKFKAMEALYKDWNEKINVISRKDIDSLYKHHVLHSLFIAMYLKEEAPDTFSRLLNGEGDILDLGTGGGFPGIPLAVLFDKSKFTLCDSVGKKIIVASEVSKALSLDNVTTVNARAESLEHRFTHVVSRAVTSLDNFYPWVKGRYSESILYLKGGDINEELSNLMRRFKFGSKSISVWKIQQKIEDSYFEGKYVINIPAK